MKIQITNWKKVLVSYIMYMNYLSSRIHNLKINSKNKNMQKI